MDMTIEQKEREEEEASIICYSTKLNVCCYECKKNSKKHKTHGAQDAREKFHT